MNQVILVGRLTADPELLNEVDDKEKCNINIAINRPYKNSEGIYETDFIKCTIWKGIAKQVCEYCKKGDLISVKAHIQNNNYTDKNNNKVYGYDIIADKISFLQTRNTRIEEQASHER